MSRPARPNDGKYRKQRAHMLRISDPVCWLCGGEIDMTLRFPHPYSAEADHVQPVSRGGDNLGPLKPAHRICNTRRGNDDGTGRTRRTNRRPNETHPGLT